MQLLTQLQAASAARKEEALRGLETIKTIVGTESAVVWATAAIVSTIAAIVSTMAREDGVRRATTYFDSLRIMHLRHPLYPAQPERRR